MVPDPAENAVTIVRELEKYSPELAGKPRWLVFNKMDLILEEELREVMDRVQGRPQPRGPVYRHPPSARKVPEGVLRHPGSAGHHARQLAEDARGAIEKVEFKWDGYPQNQLARPRPIPWRRPRPSMMVWTMTTGTMRTTTASKSFTFAIEHHVRDKTGARQAPVFYLGGSTGDHPIDIFSCLLLPVAADYTAHLNVTCMKHYANHFKLNRYVMTVLVCSYGWFA